MEFCTGCPECCSGASCEIRKLASLCVVQLRAVGAKLIVEMMKLREILFADVAVQRFVRVLNFLFGIDVVGLERAWRKDVWSREDSLAAELSDAGRIEH